MMAILTFCIHNNGPATPLSNDGGNKNQWIS